MILTSALRALGDILSPPFRAALLKVLGLTVLVLVLAWFGLDALFEAAAWPHLSAWLPAPPDWAQGFASGAGTLAWFAAGFALAVGLAFLIGPVSAAIAGLFLDDVAEVVESESYPDAPAGRAMPLLPGLFLSVKFLGIVIVGNLFALTLLLVPGVNLVAFFLVNGYLLGREYFEFAALRYRDTDEAKALRERHKGKVFAAGLVVAAFMAVPLLNLLTPLFAAAMMVHLHQRVMAREGGIGSLEARVPPVLAPEREASLLPPRAP